MLENRLVIVFAMEHYNPLGLIRTLGRYGIHPVYIAVRGRGVASSKSRYIRKVHYADTIEKGYEILLKEYSDLSEKPFVLTTDDDIQSILDLHYSELKDKFIMYNAGEDGRVTAYMDKKRILDIAEKHGLKVLPTVVTDRGVIPEGLEYPVITKAMSPTEANWKKNVFICESEEELREASQQIACSKVLIQKFIEKKNELCLDGFTIDRGRKSFIPMGTNYNYLIRGYYSPYMTAFNFKDEEMRKSLNEMFAEIGFEGIFSIEFIIDQDDTCYFSEVNFRNSTWNYIATHIGMPIPVLWCEAMLTGTIDETWNKPFPEHFTAMTEPIDYKIRVEGGRVALAQWLMDFKTTNVPFYLDTDDPEPFRAMVENWRAFS
ncbi:MAG: ATP-grasp domain-containing protein [Lachnospiraceae bacterium]|nr:ATP-grasp domain-containing protein [Lachnospiraceae bacterium]